MHQILLFEIFLLDDAVVGYFAEESKYEVEHLVVKCVLHRQHVFEAGVQNHVGESKLLAADCNKES